VPPVDIHGRLLITRTLGRLGERYRQKMGQSQMQRAKKGPKSNAFPAAPGDRAEHRHKPAAQG
jgi:hypothetical protein